MFYEPKAWAYAHAFCSLSGAVLVRQNGFLMAILSEGREN